MVLFVIGLVLGVPLAIAANLFTPRVQTLLASRSASRRERRIAKLRLQMDQVATYRDVPSVLLAVLVRGVLQVVLLSTLTIGFLVMATSNPKGNLATEFISNNAYIDTGLAFSLVTFLFDVYLVAAAITLCRKVYDAPSYLGETSRQLRKLGAEPTGGPQTEPVQNGHGSPDRTEDERSQAASSQP
jgi:hypothetical protein